MTIAPLTDPLMTRSERGRWWTSVNTAEAMQGVLQPLDFTFQARGIEIGGRRSWFDFGVLEESDVYQPEDPSECFIAPFFGRIGINVNFSAALMDQVPGVSGADLERALLGFAREGTSYTGAPEWKVARIEAGGAAVVATQGRLLAEAESEYRGWWASNVAALDSGERAGRARESLVEASERFDHAMYLHLRTRFLLIMAQGRLAQALGALGMLDAMQPMTSAVGTVEMEVADDLWRLSHGELDRGEFLARHGYHGPNEGVITSRSWREDPRSLDLAASGLAGVADADGPPARRARAVAEREALTARFLAAVSAAEVSEDAELVAGGSPRVTEAAAMVELAQQSVAWTEQGKLLTLLALDVGRAAARRYGADLLAAGLVDDAADVAYFTINEIRAGLPTNSRELVSYRRAKREEYLAYDIPLTWENDPVPVVLADVRHRRAAVGDVLRGVGGNAGVIEGRVYVVVDPTSDAIEPGDVLVCTTTDPSWLAVFAVAGAVVVDIGGPTSHGAIVAREFGLPCVMGTGNLVQTLRSGDRVRVDGAAGTVERTG